jgi:hypothetical protein
MAHQTYRHKRAAGASSWGFIDDRRRFRPAIFCPWQVATNLVVLVVARDYQREYQRRNLLARERGFVGYWQERRAPRQLRRVEDFVRLPESARHSRTEAMRVVGLARQERTTVEAAARKLKVPVGSVRYWAGDALEPTRQGRTLPRVSDGLTRLRPIFLVGEPEVVLVALRGSRAADRAHAIFAVQWMFITGEADTSSLEAIRGKRVAGRTVESDPDVLRRIGSAGGASVLDSYKDAVG